MCSLGRAGALLALVLLAFCSEKCDARAQSDRSRHRSGQVRGGPIRSVPVAADIKRDRDFDCPEEFGYYPHPSDCSQYYVCVFGGALLESCTGGLMYSHELQTCDWPRNVGCDAGGGAAGGSRGGDADSAGPSEPPPPSRRVPPPPPRPQPNPVVTSRGQPRISQEEYIKQQQLYSEIEELPPAEEVESDRPQRVYRGQPSTVGQVQRDRDGYSAAATAGRSLNANVIPVPVQQSKVGVFSFGTQVDQRRTARPEDEPQSYREIKNVTDNIDRPPDYDTIEFDTKNRSIVDGYRLIRKRRDTEMNYTKEPILKSQSDIAVDKTDTFSEETEELLVEAADGIDDIDRNKRQIWHGRYNNNGYNRITGTGNRWTTANPSKIFDFSQFSNRPNFDNGGSNHFNSFQLNNNGYQDVSNKPYLSKNTVFTTDNPSQHYQTSPDMTNKPFKASSPDIYSNRLPYNPLNAATQIITKSPPISSLTNNDNPFAALSAGFYNNHVPVQNLKHTKGPFNQHKSQIPFYYQQTLNMGNNLKHQDSSEVPSTVVTNKPVRIQTTTKGRVKYRIKSEENKENSNSNKQNNHPEFRIPNNEEKRASNMKEQQANEDEEYDEDSDEEENESNNDDHNSTTKDGEISVPDFPEPPYAFTHTKDKYADIINPFADPNFDFDTFISKLQNSHLSAIGATTISPQKPIFTSQNYPTSSTARSPIGEQNTSQRLITHSAVSYDGMSTPRPFSVPTKTIVSWPAKSHSGTTRSPLINNEHDHGKYKSYERQPHHSQNKSSKMLNTYLMRDDINLQVPIQNSNQNILTNPQKNTNVQALDDARFKNHTNNIFENENIRSNHSNYVINLSNPLQQVTQQSKYAFSGNDHIFLQTARPTADPKKRFQPPNFKDDRRLPINYNFNNNAGGLLVPSAIPTNDGSTNHFRGTNVRQPNVVTLKPYITVLVTSPTSLAYTNNPEHSFSVSPQNIPKVRPQNAISGKNAYFTTAKPQTYDINYNLPFVRSITQNTQPNKASYNVSTETPKHQFVQPQLHSTSTKNIFLNNYTTTTMNSTPKRRPIPKPSPEMNDYYYDDDDEYYYEPAIKSQFMPSSEVRPQRPPIAQNDEEYDDDESYEDEEETTESTYQRMPSRPSIHKGYQSATRLKSYNDVSEPTKVPFKQVPAGYPNDKIPVPVMVNFGPSRPPTLSRPQAANFEAMQSIKNKTKTIRKPPLRYRESGPNTSKPPKYLNQTTLRPYTVRHRLAKPTTDPIVQTTDNKQLRGQNKWRPMIIDNVVRSTTPHDSHNQETRYTKTRHDDRTNSLQPTESATPASYSPRPTAGRALYNGSQNYNPDQYDPYYALYDEDGELYKDSDYVQQYNTASFRPAVQQTYRGTPPPQPSRRPQQEYTASPVSPDDYDDALIQGQIDDQTQYQQPIRQSTRGEGNELGYEHNPSSARTTIYEASSISTTSPTTTSTSSTTSTTTKRPTSAPITEAMNPSRNTQRSSEKSISHNSGASGIRKSSVFQNPSETLSENPEIPVKLSVLAKPFERTSNSFRLDKLSSDNQISTNDSIFSNDTSLDYKIMDSSTRPLKNGKNRRPHFSLTTGFSIRRDPKNNQNPYTLTLITRPSFTHSAHANRDKVNDLEIKENLQNYFYKDISYDEKNQSDDNKTIENDSLRRKDDESKETIVFESQYGVSTNKRPIKDNKESDASISKTQIKDSIILEDQGQLDNQTTEKNQPKVYLKTVIKRPATLSLNKAKEDLQELKQVIMTRKTLDLSQTVFSTENSNVNTFDRKIPSQRRKWVSLIENETPEKPFRQPDISPYQSLEKLRQNNEKYISSEAKHGKELERLVSASPTEFVLNDYLKSPDREDDTTQVTQSNSRLQNVLEKHYLNNLTDYENQNNSLLGPKTNSNYLSNTIPKILDPVVTSNVHKDEEENSLHLHKQQETVNIGFRRRQPNYSLNGKVPLNNRRLQIIDYDQRNAVKDYLHKNNTYSIRVESPYLINNIISSTPHPSTHTPISKPIPNTEIEISKTTISSTQITPKYDKIRKSEESFEYATYVSKFESIAEKKGPSLKNTESLQSEYVPNSGKYDSDKRSDITSNTVANEILLDTLIPVLAPRQNETAYHDVDAVVTTTRMTMKTIDWTTTPKSKTSPYPTRASRINLAIKLAATNPEAGRRSYQSSSKCSTDDSLQANPKCNEIKYQRTNTRGRGSAHYSTSSGSDAPQLNNVNRGTPPARMRPTLKPSTLIVSKEATVVDIYRFPPSRPPAIYPQPTPDKTAAKCRKDVCLLPDCSCGGKEIPGNLPVKEVPQLVLITFDDAVNDLNQKYYQDLFERGRMNPNGCPIAATFYVSHEWCDYSQVQNLYADGHEMASHTISHSFGEQFSQKKWNREVAGQREILSAYGGVKLEDVRGMRAPFLSVGGNKMFKMLYDSNFTYDSSMPVYENRPPSWPYTLDYKLFHDCMIPPCPTRSYPGVWEVPMVMWQDLNGGRCSMGDACANPPTAEGVYKMLLKNFDRHYTTNRAPFGLFYHAAWFTQPHHKEGFIMFMDAINQMKDVFFVTNWQALQWVRDPTPLSRINSFQPFQCDYPDRPKRCNNPKVCNLWHKSGVRYMRTCQPCPDVFPWTGKTGIRSSRIDNEIEE